MRTFIFILLIAFSNAAFSQSNAKTKKIKALLELTGSGNLGMRVLQNMVTNFKKTYSEVSEKFWDDFMKEVNADDLENLIVPIYDKHFTEAEIDDLTKFYRTPTGKKMIEMTPTITDESMQVGRAWGKELGEKVAKRLKDQGYIKE
jgi:hypothetical protein